MHCNISKTWLCIALLILRLRLPTQNSSFLLLSIKKSMSDILWFSMRWLIQFALMWSQLYWVLELICQILCSLEMFRLSLLCYSVGMIDNPHPPTPFNGRCGCNTEWGERSHSEPSFAQSSGDSIANCIHQHDCAVSVCAPSYLIERNCWITLGFNFVSFWDQHKFPSHLFLNSHSLSIIIHNQPAEF